MADTASVLHHFNDSTLKHENYSFDPLSSPSPSNEHLPLVNMARVTFERRTLGKPELHIGSSEQEKKFALQNAGPPESQVWQGTDRKITTKFNSTERCILQAAPMATRNSHMAK